MVQNDAAGQEIADSRRHYEPYGKLRSDLVPADQGPGYTGHVTDVLTGFSYMQQRYYDPIAGRFLSTDPILANPSTGANFNRYAYANNNPYRFVDPDGRCPKQVGSHICIESAKFDPSRSSGKNAMGTPAMDSAVRNQRAVVQTKKGARDEPLGSLNEQEGGELKVQLIRGSSTENGRDADKARGRPPLRKL